MSAVTGDTGDDTAADAALDRGIDDDVVPSGLEHVRARSAELFSVLRDDEASSAVRSVARDDLSSILTGRANPGMFARVNVDYYGSATPITQLSSINVPEARLVVIKPYEANQLRNIEDAIRNSDLGVNPTNDGNIIRIVFPQLTEERRKDLIKVARHKAEDARVSIRNIRRKAKEELDRLVKDGETGEDEVTRAEKELQGTTDRYVHQVDDLVKHKETELLEV